MRKLMVFNQVTLDGYFTDQNGDTSWAHRQDAEWDAFTTDNARGGAELLFGRVTYDLMSKFWQTPQAREQMPAVAEAMNALPKMVFSRTLDRVTWPNTRLIQHDMIAAVRDAKQESASRDLLIMGSGTIVAQLAEAGLIDEYQIVLVPVVLGNGRTMFEGMRKRLPLELERTKSFENGNVVLWYRPGREKDRAATH